MKKKEFPKRKRLYEKELNDREIAEEVGVSSGAIASWRNSRGYPQMERLGTAVLIFLKGENFTSRGSTMPKLPKN